MISHAMRTHGPFTSFVALGDSFTEGMSDGLPDGGYRGWADLLAGRLAARSPGFRYANLAVRGKLIDQIVDEQVGPVEAMDADLVTLVGGLNDVLRPRVRRVPGVRPAGGGGGPAHPALPLPGADAQPGEARSGGDSGAAADGAVVRLRR